MNTEIIIKREVAVKTMLMRVRQKSNCNKKMLKIREVQNKFIRENDNFISLIKIFAPFLVIDKYLLRDLALNDIALITDEEEFKNEASNGALDLEEYKDLRKNVFNTLNKIGVLKTDGEVLFFMVNVDSDRENVSELVNMYKRLLSFISISVDGEYMKFALLPVNWGSKPVYIS